MAKVSFTKLGLKKKEEIKNITINDQVIEVKQYLPISDNIDFVTNSKILFYLNHLSANGIVLRIFNFL